MAELWSLALTYAPALWQRRWIAIIIAWLVCVVGWPAVALIPSYYHAQARVFVDTHSLLQPLLSGIAVDIDPTQQVDILKQTLTSQNNLDSVVRLTNPGSATWSTNTLANAVAATRRNLQITSTEDNVFTIGFNSNNPATAQTVVQAFLNLFLDGGIGLAQSDLKSAQTFLTNQVAEYEKRSRDADVALAHFKEVNAELLTTGLSYGDALAKAQSDVDGLAAKIQDLEAKVTEYRAELKSVPRYVATSHGDVAVDPSSTAGRIQAVQATLDNLRLRYTDKHPQVIDTERLLAELKAQAAKEARTGVSSGGADASESGVYQQITLELVDAQADIATTQTQLARRKVALDNLKQQQTKVPALEAELNRLKNADDLAHSSYQELSARLQSANLSGDRESQVNRVQFRIIDAPQLPNSPSGTKRSLLLSGVLVLGLAVGFAGIFVLVLMQHTFVDVRRLAKVIDYPVLGSISRLEVPREMRIHLLKSSLFVTSLVGLFVVYSGLMLVERSYGVSVLVPEVVKHAMPSSNL